MLCRAPLTSGVSNSYREGTSKCTITGFQANHMSKTKSVSIWCLCLKNLVLWNNFLVSSIMTSTSTFKAKIYQILLGKYWHFGTDHSFKSLETPFVSENLLVILMKSLWYVARLNWTKKSPVSIFHPFGSYSTKLISSFDSHNQKTSIFGLKVFFWTLFILVQFTYSCSRIAGILLSPRQACSFVKLFLAKYLLHLGLGPQSL